MGEEINDWVKKFEELPVEEQVKIVKSITAWLEPLIPKIQDIVSIIINMVEELRKQYPELFTKYEEDKG